MSPANSAGEEGGSPGDRGEPLELPIGFAHRGGAQRRADQNTLPAFERALRLGARGLESDVALTADGVPVLVHALPMRRGGAIRNLRREQLPAWVPSLVELYERCGTSMHLSFDMADPRAVDEVVRLATERDALDHLWLCYWNGATLRDWRNRWPSVRLVRPLMLPPLRDPGPALGRLVEDGVDVVNVWHRQCTRRLVARAHEAGLLLFAWGIRSDRSLRRALAAGADGVYADSVASLVRTTGSARNG
ncbi:MAG: glycerophosphodiester phosphodiesterase [Candidatus Dormibacteria bacterium]